MYFVQDAHSFWDWIYFVSLIVVSLSWGVWPIDTKSCLACLRIYTYLNTMYLPTIYCVCCYLYLLTYLVFHWFIPFSSLIKLAHSNMCAAIFWCDWFPSPSTYNLSTYLVGQYYIISTPSTVYIQCSEAMPLTYIAISSALPSSSTMSVR